MHPSVGQCFNNQGLAWLEDQLLGLMASIRTYRQEPHVSKGGASLPALDSRAAPESAPGR